MQLHMLQRACQRWRRSLKKVQRYHAAYSSLCCAPFLSLPLPAQAILMADQWDLYNEPGVDFIKHTPCPALNSLPPFYFIFEPQKKQSKAKRNRIQRTQNEKKSDITKTKERRGNPRFYVRVERLWSRFNHFGYSSCVLSLSPFLHLQLSVPVLLPVSNIFCSLRLSGQREVAGLRCCTF